MTAASQAGSPNPVMTRLAGGPYSPIEAAEMIGASVDWMRRNAHRLPHRRYGQRIVFELEDIEEIKQMHRQGPATPRGLTPVPPRR